MPQAYFKWFREAKPVALRSFGGELVAVGYEQKPPQIPL